MKWPVRVRLPWGARRGAAAGVLRDVCRELDALNESTESDFLRVLNHLRQFLDSAREISGGCSSLADVLTSENATQAEQYLHEVLSTARTAGRGRGSQEVRLLDEAAGRMRDLETRASSLRAPVRVFHSLGVYTRIERERLGSSATDFEGLSEHVGQLASDLKEKSELISDSCASVRNVVETALETAAEMEGRRGEELPRILEAARASLSALSSKQRQASELSRSLAADFAKISEEISETVRSLQYHDITRQRVEHARDALEQAAGQGSGKTDAAKAAAVALLEAAHLRDTERDFGKAVGRIQDSLRRMTTEIREMADRTAGLLESGSNSEAFFRDLETNLAAVASALADYGDSTSVMVSAAKDVTAAVDPIARFAGEIEDIGLRIHRVSLNANVKAARLGTSGAALAAIAGSIQETAAGAGKEIHGVLESIASIADSARSLSQDIAPGESGGGLGGRTRTGELSRVTAVLRGRADQAGKHAAELANSGRSFAESVAALAESVQVAELFREVSERCVEQLETAGRTASQAEVAGFLEDLRDSYTMETERETHNSVIQGSSSAARDSAPEAESPEPAAMAELGDNVELF